MSFSIVVLFLVYMVSGGPVATCAGSSGGAQPPPDPYRLPSQCEAEPPARNQVKRKRIGRGKAKGINVEKEVAAHGRVKLSFDRVGRTWKAVGPYAAWYDSAVGIHTRKCCEPFHDSWRKVPSGQKAEIRERMMAWFNIDMSGIVSGVLNRDSQKCYRDWKNDLVAHYTKHNTPEEAIVDPHPTVVVPGHWERCCQRFASPEFKEISNRNKRNRKKNTIPSFHGRRSYAQARTLKGNLETNELYSAIENWKDMRMHGDEWANDVAEQIYNIMVAERRAHLAQSASDIQAIEYRILEQVLGERRGHRNGVGPTLPQKYLEDAQLNSNSQQNARIQRLEILVTELIDIVRQFLPNIQLPEVDAPSSASSSSSKPSNN